MEGNEVKKSDTSTLKLNYKRTFIIGFAFFWNFAIMASI